MVDVTTLVLMKWVLIIVSVILGSCWMRTSTDVQVGVVNIWVCLVGVTIT